MRDPDCPSPKTVCPFCLGRESRVMQTRPSSAKPGSIWRRRECTCGARYSTTESTTIFHRRTRERIHVPSLFPDLV